MAFKIVQTIEKGKLNLTIVPCKWENDGVLFWPKNKIERYIYDKNSVPHDDWTQMSCILKRQNINNYDEAEEELSNMCEGDDTGASDTNDRPVSKKIRTSKKKASMPVGDFNNLVPTEPVYNEQEQIVTEDKSDSFIPNVQQRNPAHGFAWQELNKMSSEPPVVILQNEPISNSMNIDISDFIAENTSVEEKIDTIIANQTIIIERLATVETILDELMKKPNKEVMSTITDVPDNVIPLLSKPIDTLEELKAFEEKLKDKILKDTFIQEMSNICGRSGKGDGINNCYTLIDKIFTRKFMTLCSWAGGSKDKSDNIPFKFYKNVIDVFFSIIHLADNEFTLIKTETFLKNIIRNKTRRNESELKRCSKKKNRPSNLSYNKETNVQHENTDTETNEQHENTDTDSNNLGDGNETTD